MLFEGVIFELASIQLPEIRETMWALSLTALSFLLILILPFYLFLTLFQERRWLRRKLLGSVCLSMLSFLGYSYAFHRLGNAFGIKTPASPLGYCVGRISVLGVR